MERVFDFYEAVDRADGLKAVVFDMDDTLYPELDYVKSGYRQVAKYAQKNYGVKKGFAKLYTLFEEKKDGVFNRFAEKENLDANKVVGEFLAIYRNQSPDIKLYAPVKKLLKSLRDKGFKIGLLSDGDPIRQRAKANALGLKKYIDEFTFSGDFGDEYKKPSTVPFEDICKKLCVLPSEMLYVGDNPKKDFAVKKELPILTMQVGGGIYKKEEYLFGVRPDYVLDKPLYAVKGGRG